MLYKCQDLKFNYHSGDQLIPALQGVNAQIDKGDFICLSGPSGSGKSTFLNLLGLIEPVQTGKLTFTDVEVAKLSESEKNKIRKYDLGFIFQFFHLMPVLSAYENVEFFLLRQGLKLSERRERVENALKAVGLLEFKNQRPLQLSGGQRQRVAMARALAKNPKVIIADEPTASLDQKTGHEIMEILLRLNKEKGVSIVLASHDPMVIDLAPKNIVLQDGKIHEIREENNV